ncbi:MAG TPA: HlyD family efflux transporter periplasmic adaptor subunit, partial [Vicinamibacterales bacterium]|nr:HlyD family efflux transporter periplasmic adaptor subunit [Vicinamibacterales bacterium]
AVTWISTLAINASPFMRFDGYFLLSDWLDIPNLHARAFALARWRLRELLFALDEDKPEYFSAGRERFMVLFAWLTWVYRLVLFLGIAVLVYRHFFKALGLILFAVEIAWFVALPIGHELREWWARRRAIVSSSRARVTAALVAVGLMLCAAPLDRQIGAPAVLRPVHVMTLFAPDAGVVVVPPRSRGEVVHAGEALMQLSSPDLLRRRGLADAGHAQLEAQLAAAALDPELRVDLAVLRERLAALQSELQGLAQESARLTPVAAFAGTVVDADPDLRSGDAVARNERLATLIDPTLWEVRAYFEEGDVRRVSLGDRARFYPETAGVPPIDITVALIDSDASRALGESMLASTHGGRIPVRAHRESAGPETLIPERAIYGVTFRAAHPPGAEAHEERGTIVIEGSPRTILGGYVRTAAAVIIREAGW